MSRSDNISRGTSCDPDYAGPDKSLPSSLHPLGDPLLTENDVRRIVREELGNQ